MLLVKGISPMEKINGHRTELRQRKVEMENRIEAAKKATLDIQGGRQACELVSKNLTELSFKNKRFALEALNIKCNC